ncbi:MULTISPECIES: CaiB/BaiF CoA-transferase family protein [unclassified Rhodococcus (in: high G+C Gram-positive bacteria)]|uniref:CaiB/BaiF CoA transferase family protein n=1 Tax=unclassified Rhodococcus (in: high G+C Gram-positive bacteria) TaxID=192944 RepID=UPI00163A55DA|nr:MULTISPECIES: CoA transferase [unclassified Rhodococcus (in: high G+C Gram-positive bacteria)]MBC2639464.1 CoA transferase [Rhodococcus sp. 3A]MBC2895791.1 CoA transferase [Rhodococcus sp. 4CII]
MTLPLTGVRVLDLTDGLGESCGRYLADLGAQVTKVEGPGGARSRRAEPVVDGVSIPFALRNANKRGIVVDLDDPAGRDRLRQLATESDIVVESHAPGLLSERGVGAAELSALAPALVCVSVTPFGQTGPYRDWVATEQVLYALSGVLSRSGAPGAEPLLPPAGLVEETVGMHAAWSALLAYYDRLRTGRGQVVDLSAFEALVHGFDPGFGTQGSAAAGRSDDFPRGRPDASNFYPVFPCADGHVRICLLAKRQWRGMFEWLGEPAEFADPKYDTIPARFAAAGTLHPLIEALFATRTRDQLVAEGAARGVPVGGVLSLGEVLTTEHFDVSGALADVEIAAGVQARIPTGYVSIDGARAGIRTPAPEVGEHDATPVATREHPTRAGFGNRRPGARPLEGLRVLDLGVIVFGAELSRQFADYGADVIKVENAKFPDGLRQSKRGAALAASVAWGHRNKRSLGLDVRSPEGRDVFRRLVVEADVVLANFKPGTLASMGLSYDELAALNPRIIVSESSAFGSTGPWNTRLGYGPLVRAACGVSALWRYPEHDDLLCDGSTVYPDHIAAHVTAIAVLAALIQRTHTGRGAALEVAQADTALVQLGAQLVTESLRPGTVSAPGNSDPFAAPAGVFACAGDDEWCVVSVRDDDDWARLCAVIGRPELASVPAFRTRAERIRNRADVDDVLHEWLQTQPPAQAVAALQAAGVPAGMMLRLPELLTDPHLAAREAYTLTHHDLLPKALPTAARVARFSGISDPPLRQAPIAGQHTREICEDVLRMPTAEMDRLVAEGVLQPPVAEPAPVAEAAAALR